MLFYWNFLLRVVEERNETIIFVFTFSHLFQTYFGLKRIHNCILYFFEFFWYFFGIFYFESGRNGTERNDNFYFLSFSTFSNLFRLKWSHNGIFFIFWIFLLFFCNLFLRVGLERNRTIIFIFSLCPPFPTYFGLKWSHNGIF